MGLLTGSAAAGQLVFMPLLAALADTHGWRAAVWVGAAIALVPLPLVIFFVRDRPADIGLKAYGAVGIDGAPAR
jgi:sugar phosphate permease